MTFSPDSWPHVYRPGRPDTVFLMLHGTGSNENDIVSLADAIDPSATVLAPRGTVTEGGMLRWFHRFHEGVFDVESVEREATRLASFVEWAAERYGFTPNALTAIGFSNGANIALATGIRHPTLVPSVAAFSGMYPFADRTLDDDLSTLRVLVLNGGDDPMAPRASVDRLEGELLRQHADVTRHVRPGSHGIHPAEVEAARSWIAEPPATA